MIFSQHKQTFLILPKINFITLFIVFTSSDIYFSSSGKSDGIAQDSQHRTYQLIVPSSVETLSMRTRRCSDKQGVNSKTHQTSGGITHRSLFPTQIFKIAISILKYLYYLYPLLLFMKWDSG